ncbi:MAG: ATP-binding protein, partial [Candidatus Binatia bacterium]
ERTLLRDVGVRLHPDRDEIARAWAQRLIDRLGPPFTDHPDALPRLSELNLWFLEGHLDGLRRGDVDGILRSNFDADLALLRSQRENEPSIRSTLSQLYLSLQVSTGVIVDRLTEVYRDDARLPQILNVYGRLALVLGEVLGRAFYEVRSEETQSALRAVSSLLEASRELNTRPESVAGVLGQLTRIVNRLVVCDKSLVFLWNEAEQAYVAEAGLGFSAEHFGEIHSMRFRRGTFSMMDDILDGRTASGTRDDGRVPRQTMERYDEMTYAVTPMNDSRGRPLGTLAAYRREPSPFDETDLEILKGVAQVAALAIENAQLVEKLAASSRLKSDFINSMSHEIRTPINVLAGYLDMLSDRRRGDPEDIEILRRMKQNTGYLLALVNTILDVGRIEAGKMPLRLDVFSIAEVLQALRDAFGATAAARGLRFECRTEADLPPLRTDRLKVLEILNNLVGNAFKFTDRGSITVTAGAVDGLVCFEVRDTGIGIQTGALGEIFDVFRQGGSSDRGGTGLGLYIVKRLSGLLGGSVSVESELGRGSTFRVSIPASLRPASEADVAAQCRRR